MPENEGTAPNEIDEAPLATTAEVAAVVRDVQRTHRGRIHWSVGRHTAELALRALGSSRRLSPRPSSPKSRRRKRYKRML